VRISREIAGALLFASGVGGCASGPPAPQRLATAQVAPDFRTYELRRVGLMPLALDRRDAGSNLGEETANLLQEAFYGEVSRATPYEVVRLRSADLEDVPGSQPHRRGFYDARTILELARRHRLDALLVGALTLVRSHPPQALSVQMDLVAAETGAVLWTGSVHLDAADERVQASLEAYLVSERSGAGSRDSLQILLLSPSRFARFAAWQMCQLL
jgi:hypothetical protein